MAAVIQIKRRLNTAGVPPTLAAGELAYNYTGGPTPANDLYVGNGTDPGSAGVSLLISRNRQVELTGDQTITGNKTIDLNNLKILGGLAGNVPKTNGDGNLYWDQGTVSTGPSIRGDGSATDPLDVIPANSSQIAIGTDDVNAVTSAGLREIMGLGVADLETSAKTVVPALNELVSKMVALTGVVILIGVYNVEMDHVHSVEGSPFGPGGTEAPLPPASQDNLGWYLIVEHGGTPTTGVLADQGDIGSVATGDWLLSNGVVWLHFIMRQEVIAASQIAVASIPGSSAANVQEALEEIYSGGALHVATDNFSILGTGHTESPLTVGTVDGGTYPS